RPIFATSARCAARRPFLARAPARRGTRRARARFRVSHETRRPNFRARKFRRRESCDTAPRRAPNRRGLAGKRAARRANLARRQRGAQFGAARWLPRCHLRSSARDAARRRARGRLARAAAIGDTVPPFAARARALVPGGPVRDTATTLVQNP